MRRVVDQDAKDVDVAVVSVANRTVRRLTEAEIDEHLNAIAERD